MKHILLVDDVATNLKCAEEVLKEKYVISTAKSGTSALEKMETIQPDLVLLDINMPDMDGFEMMQKMKEMPNIEQIPVVVLTAETDGVYEERSLEMGAMDFIRKPFAPGVLLSKVQETIERAEGKN